MIDIKVEIALAHLLLLLALSSEAKLAVQYGGDEALDACSTLAEVRGLSHGPDGFLAVKDEPNLKAKRIDKIFNGQRLWICETSKNAGWVGVVYTKDKNQNCGTSRPVPKKGAYRGPCKSGWVNEKYLDILAG